VYKILSKLVDECWRYSKPKQCHFWAWLKTPIFGVPDSQGSAETLVKRGEITNYHSVAYSFSNISAKNCQNRLMCIEVSVQRHCRFFETHWYCGNGTRHRHGYYGRIRTEYLLSDNKLIYDSEWRSRVTSVSAKKTTISENDIKCHLRYNQIYCLNCYTHWWFMATHCHGILPYTFPLVMYDPKLTFEVILGYLYL